MNDETNAIKNQFYVTCHQLVLRINTIFLRDVFVVTWRQYI